MSIIFAEEVRQYLYCERILFFRRKHNFKQRSSYLMDKGVNYHAKKKEYNVDYANAVEIFQDRLFINQDLAFGGKVDMLVVEKDGICAVEFKRFLNKQFNINHSHVIQGMVGGLAASWELKMDLKRIEIRGYKGVVQTIFPNGSLISKTHSIFSKIRELIGSDKIPDPTPSTRKCDECEFWNVCMRI